MIVDDWEVGRRGLMDLFTLHLHCDMEWVWNEESVDMVSNTSLIQVNSQSIILSVENGCVGIDKLMRRVTPSWYEWNSFHRDRVHLTNPLHSPLSNTPLLQHQSARSMLLTHVMCHSLISLPQVNEPLLPHI